METTDFKRRVTMQAVAHVCLASGCTRAFPSVIETLADVMKQYIAEIGVHARGVADHGGRADINVIDILAAMKQIGKNRVPNVVSICVIYSRSF
jgi:histone H3/H4